MLVVLIFLLQLKVKTDAIKKIMLELLIVNGIIYSFLQGWNPHPPPFSERMPPFWVSPSFWSKFKNLPPLSESHPNWCIKIVRNTSKWRCYVSYYTKSIENIINITLFTFRLNSVFYYLHFLWLDKHETFLIIRLSILMCI